LVFVVIVKLPLPGVSPIPTLFFLKFILDGCDMPYNLIKKMLLGMQEIESGEFSDYQFNEPS